MREEKVQAIYQKMFVDGALDYQAQLFGWMIDGNYFCRGRPKSRAAVLQPYLHAFQPVEPGVTDMKAALQTLEKRHIRQFAAALYDVVKRHEAE